MIEIPNHNLYVCKKDHGSTQVVPFREWGTLRSGGEIVEALDAEEGLSPGGRVMRGDFES